MKRIKKIKDKNDFDPLGIKNFNAYLTSFWKLFFYNFVAGVARGFGLIVGMTILVSVVLFAVGKMIGFPVIGKYFEPINDIIVNSVSTKQVIQETAESVKD